MSTYQEENNRHPDTGIADVHFQFRRCANCGSGKMAPVSQYRDSDLGPITSFGLLYECPQCQAQMKIRGGSSLVTGGFVALITGIIGWWAFQAGPLWYATHLSYFTEDYYELSFIIFDLFAFIFYTLVAALAAWIVWREFIVPVKARFLHRATGENRGMRQEEIASSSRSRKLLLISFFIFPLLIYIPLFAGIWLLDAVGIDIRENEIFKFAGLVGIFAGAMLLARRFKVEFALVFFGMVFWMAIAIAVVFTLG